MSKVCSLYQSLVVKNVVYSAIQYCQSVQTYIYMLQSLECSQIFVCIFTHPFFKAFARVLCSSHNVSLFVIATLKAVFTYPDNGAQQAAVCLAPFDCWLLVCWLALSECYVSNTVVMFCDYILLSVFLSPMLASYKCKILKPASLRPVNGWVNSLLTGRLT